MSNVVGIAKRTVAATAALALGLMGAVAFGSAANAAPTTPIAGPVTEQDGSIIIHKQSNPGFGGIAQNPDGSSASVGKPLNGVTFEVCSIAGIDLIGGGNAAWEEVVALGLLAPALPNSATTIGAGADAHALTCLPKQITANDGTTTFATLPVGAYLVRETAAPANVVGRAAPFVVTVPTPSVTTSGGTTANAGEWLYNVHVYPKNQVLDVPVKNIEEQGNAVLQGDDVKYTISQKVPGLPAGESYSKIQILDILDAKLTPSTKVPVTVSHTRGTVTTVLKKDDDYTAVWSGQTLTAALTTAFLAGIQEGDVLTVKLAATANKSGSLTNDTTANINDMVVDGNQVITRWGSLDIVKVNAITNDPLIGAQFELYMGVDGSAGCSAATTGNIKVADLESDANGKLGVKVGTTVTPLGLLWVGDTALIGGAMPNDITERCYFLIETKAPAGFVLDQTPREFIVNANAAAVIPVEIENTQQEVPELPLTGAAGQLMLGAGGVSLLAIAVGLLMMRRRKSAHPAE